ncbi:hypothetical protein BDZ97DRAFT_920872 [Flammula alnicola]|nr:hypothetical protein BDZ97DRAFT_920872 [Flammula alnicola]
MTMSFWYTPFTISTGKWNCNPVHVKIFDLIPSSLAALYVRRTRELSQLASISKAFGYFPINTTMVSKRRQSSYDQLSISRISHGCEAPETLPCLSPAAHVSFISMTLANCPVPGSCEAFVLPLCRLVCAIYAEPHFLTDFLSFAKSTNTEICFCAKLFLVENGA